MIARASAISALLPCPLDLVAKGAACTPSPNVVQLRAPEPGCRKPLRTSPRPRGIGASDPRGRTCPAGRRRGSHRSPSPTSRTEARGRPSVAAAPASPIVGALSPRTRPRWVRESTIASCRSYRGPPLLGRPGSGLSSRCPASRPIFSASRRRPPADRTKRRAVSRAREARVTSLSLTRDRSRTR